MNDNWLYLVTQARRVVAHVDLDGFYAAVERRRLGRSAEAKIAVEQWGSLIAVGLCIFTDFAS